MSRNLYDGDAPVKYSGQTLQTGSSAATVPLCRHGAVRCDLCAYYPDTASYEALLDAERRALAYQEFIAHTLDFYGERLPSQWKAHARAVLADD